MAYDSNTGTITRPINFKDISDALSIGSGDLGTLCTSQKINRWAKYKPTKVHNLGMTGETSGSDYWKGDGASTSPYVIAGLKADYYSTLGSFSQHPVTYKITTASGFLHELIHDNLSWEHVRPTGGVGSQGYPYRPLDFDGYMHTAVSPMPVAPSGQRPFGESHLVTLIASIPAITSSRNLTLDIMSVPSVISTLEPVLSEFYLGVVLFKSDYSDMVWKTASEPLSDTSAEGKRSKVSIITMNHGFTRAGEWKCLTFLSSIGGLDSDDPLTWGNTGIFLPADLDIKTVVLTDSTVGTSVKVITAKWISVASGIPTDVNCVASLENQTGSSATFTNIRMVLVDSFGDVMAEHNFSQETVAPAGSKSISYRFQDVLYTDLTAKVFATVGTENKEDVAIVER